MQGHKSSATSDTGVSSGGRIALSRWSLNHSCRLPSFTHGHGYSVPTRSRNASTLFSPQYAAANSAGIRRGHEPGGIIIGRAISLVLACRGLVRDAEQTFALHIN